MKNEVLRMEHIKKSYHEVDVLDDFKLNLYKGEVLGIIALSDSGKTTITNILAGIEKIDKGQIYINELAVEINTRLNSRMLRIFCIHHEMLLVPFMSVAENVFIIKTHKRKKWYINWKAINIQTKILLNEIGIDISPKTISENLTLAQQHLVQICKAIASNSKIIVFDDIMDSYTEIEKERLSRVIQKLKSDGISFIMQSHSIEDLMKFSDRMAVLRDGKNIKVLHHEEFKFDLIIQLLLDDNSQEFQNREVKENTNLMDFINVSSIGFTNLSFHLQSAEILGILDIENKASKNLYDIFSENNEYSGCINIDGKNIKISSFIDALKARIGVVPESIAEAVIWNLSILDNIIIMVLKKMKKYRLIHNKRVIKYLKSEYGRILNIEKELMDHNIMEFDTYVKQRVILHRIMLCNPRVIVLSNPCSNVDLISKGIIKDMLEEYIKKNIGVLILSSDKDEVSTICDRIIVIKNGRRCKEYSRDEMKKININELY